MKRWIIYIAAIGMYVTALWLRRHYRSEAMDFLFLFLILLLWGMAAAAGNKWHAEVDGPAAVKSGAYAGVWFRFVAGLMDFMFAGLAVVGIFNLSLKILAAKAVIILPYFLGNGGARIQQLIVLSVGLWLYFAFMESSPLEATVCKLVFRLRVTDPHGHRISFAQATLRYLGKLVSLGTFLIGFLVAIFTARKQTLHDLVAKTVVVDG